MSLAAPRLSKVTFSDVEASNKLVDQARSAAEMGFVLPCGVVNLNTCSVFCYADAVFENAEGEKSQCGIVVAPTHHLELVRTWTS